MIDNVAATLPSELFAESKLPTVYVCEPPAAIDMPSRHNTRWSSGPTDTIKEEVSVLPLFDPVTVCAPATVAVQLAPPQVPFGVIENDVPAVTSPSELFAESKPSAVNPCDPPDAMVALPGVTTMW